MKNFNALRTSLVVLVSMQLFAAPSIAAPTAKTSVATTNYFQKFRKDPDAWDVVNDPKVQAAMKKVMGNKVSDFFDVTQMLEMADVEGDSFTTYGGIRGLFTLTETVFNLNLKTGEVCVGVLDIDKIKVYGTKNGTSVPKPVREYLTNLAQRKHGEKLAVIYAQPDWSKHESKEVAKPKKLNLNTAIVTGEYERIGVDTRFEGGSLQVEKLDGNRIKFNLMACSGAHSGGAEGIIPIKDNLAVYKNDAFTIEMKFSGNTVTICQEGEGFGGIGVTAAGIYEKTDDQTPAIEISSR